MTSNPTRTEKARRLDAFLSNDDNFKAVSYDDPRAVALRAKAAARFHKKQAGRARQAEKEVAIASTFAIGQLVNCGRGVIGEVVAIDGSRVSVSVAGEVSKYIASALTAA